MPPVVRFELPEWVAEESGDPRRQYRLREERMDLALRLAERNVERGEGGPFGACVFESDSGLLVSAGVNLVVRTNSSLAHAEALAVMLAQHAHGTFDLGAKDLPPMELVSTAQPCIQCYGILWWSGLRRVVIGATAQDVESLTGFREGPLPTDWAERLADRSPLPPVEVITDCLRARARRLLREYRDRGGPVYIPGGDKKQS
jgi:tRNA(Arg) A34 adenosine deaminase TadA